MSKCSIAGCNKPLKARTWCAAHWARWSATGDPLGSKPHSERDCNRCNRPFTPDHPRNVYCAACKSARKVEARAEKRAYDKQRHQENLEEARRANRQYAAAHREERKAYDAWYRKANADKRAFHEQKRQVVKRGCRKVFPFTKDQLDQRMSVFGYKCWMCGAPYEEVDHVKPISRGGLHALCNLRPACAACNRSKRDTWPFALVS